MMTSWAQSAVPGLPFPLDTASTVAFDYRYSADGTHLLAEVQMDTGASTDDGAMTLDSDDAVLQKAVEHFAPTSKISRRP